MEYRYFTLGREPRVSENILVSGRRAKVKFVSPERKFIGRTLILRQPELRIDNGLAAVRVGFDFID